MAKDKERLLHELKQKKHSCTADEAETVLKAWGFEPGRVKGHAQVWAYKELTLTLHRPHKKHMDPGAVAIVIRLLEAADLIRQQEGKNDG